MTTISKFISSGRRKILDEIVEKRERQDKKFGVQNHPPLLWLAILGEEVGECNKAALEHECKYFYKQEAPLSKLHELREEMVQVAAVALSILESLDRNELKEPATDG